jgi:hypothetical protein
LWDNHDGLCPDCRNGNCSKPKPSA